MQPNGSLEKLRFSLRPATLGQVLHIVSAALVFVERWSPAYFVSICDCIHAAVAKYICCLHTNVVSIFVREGTQITVAVGPNSLLLWVVLHQLDNDFQLT